MKKILLLPIVMMLVSCASGRPMNSYGNNSSNNNQVVIRHGLLTTFDTIYQEAQRTCGTNSPTFVSKIDGNHSVFNCR